MLLRKVSLKICSKFSMRTPMLKYDFKKSCFATLLKSHFGKDVLLQICLLHIYGTPFPKNTSGELFVKLIRCVTLQKMKFFIKDFFSICDQIRTFLRIWSHLPRQSLMENFIFCAVRIQKPVEHLR